MPGAPFRKRNAAALYQQHIGPNMTPMVDVVMVILIFFMASAAFLGPEWFLRTNLPVQGTASAGSEPVRLLIGLSQAAGETVLTMNGEASPWERLEPALKDQFARAPDRLIVLVSPAEDVPYDAVVRVHEACARVGITRVGLTP